MVTIEVDLQSRISRRDLLRGAAISTVAIVAEIFKPWERFAPHPDRTQPETLPSLVAQAKKMEDEFKDQDLSNKVTREKYADLLAGIFAFHHPDYLSRQQLKETIIFTDTLTQFVQQRINSSGKTGTPTPRQLENNRFTTASTDNRTRKITVNVASAAFYQKNLNQMDNLPTGWNPLKTLRLALTHEFNHLVDENQDPDIFSVIDPYNEIKDRRIEGFRFIGIDEKGNIAAGLDYLHEAVIEFQARDTSQVDFGSYFSSYSTEFDGQDITVLMARLDRVVQAIGISHEELGKLHKKSNLRQFILTLADKGGFDSGFPLKQRIIYGLTIAGIIERGNERALQDYINKVTRLKQNS